MPKKSWGFEESPEEWIGFRSVGALRSDIYKREARNCMAQRNVV